MSFERGSILAARRPWAVSTGIVFGRAVREALKPSSRSAFRALSA
jgi:hypothetical protein